MLKIGVLSSGSQSAISLIKSLNNLKKNYKIEVIAFDIDINAAGLYLADSFSIIDKVSSSNYLKKLIKQIKKNKINTLIPQLDSEIKFLIKYKNYIYKKTKCKLIINNKFTILNSLNKMVANKLCISNKINVPEILNLNKNRKIKFSKIIYRPFTDIGSKNIILFSKEEFYKLDHCNINKLLSKGFFQKFQIGQEYTIDIINNNYKPIYIIPRKRIKVTNGQITIGETVINKKLINFSKKIIKIFKIKHHACLQCIKHKNKIFFIELNPRFGTGMTLSELAGAKLTETLIFKKNTNLNRNIKNVKFSRYWSEVIVK